MSEAYQGVEDGGPVREAVSSDAQVAAASALLEAVARERGLDVQRLDDEVVVCDDGQRRVLFHGLVSSSTGKLAHALCSNDAWLRAHLARHGLPVVPTRLVGADDLDFARSAAEALGFPVRMRLASGPGEPGEGDPRTATDEDSFSLAWGDLIGAVADGRRQVVLDVVPHGREVRVTVVAGQAMAASPTGAGASEEAARDLAVLAMTRLPGAPYGLVRLAATESGLLIDRVTLSGVASGATRQCIEAVLKAELATA